MSTLTYVRPNREVAWCIMRAWETTALGTAHSWCGQRSPVRQLEMKPRSNPPPNVCSGCREVYEEQTGQTIGAREEPLPSVATVELGA